MRSSDGLIRREIEFLPAEEILIPIKGINMRLYAWILKALEKGTEYTGDESLDLIIHESVVKPFTCSLLMPSDDSLRARTKERIVFVQGAPHYRFRGPFKLFFASMLQSIVRNFLIGLKDSEPPFNASIYRVRPLKVKPQTVGIYNTLSPVYAKGLHPTTKEFREVIVDELKRRIALFREHIDVKSLKEPRFELLYDTAKGMLPERTVVFIDEKRKASVEAYRFKFKMVAPEPYVSAALLGGLGYKTHLCFGYINYYFKKRS